MNNQYDPNDLNAVLSRLETGQAIISKQISEHSGEEKDRWDKLAVWAKDTDGRVRKLENWRYYVIGIAGGAGFVLVKVWEWLTGKHGQ